MLSPLNRVNKIIANLASVIHLRLVLLSHLNRLTVWVYSRLVRSRLQFSRFMVLLTYSHSVLIHLIHEVDSEWHFDEVEAQEPKEGAETHHHWAIKEAIAITPLLIIVVGRAVWLSLG